MVKMSCPPLFIDFLALFPQFGPLFPFSWPGGYLSFFLRDLWVILMNLFFWFGVFMRWVTLISSRGKSCFSTFAYRLGSHHLAFCILLTFSLFHRIDPTEVRHRTFYAALEVS
jgi:hypothetical protein